MEKKRRIILSAGVMVIGAIAAAIFIKEKTKKSTYMIGATSVDEKITPIPHRQKAFYERFVKRVLDVICALLAFIIFFPIYVSVALLVRIKLGTPILFTQDRPGEIDRKTGKETIFKLYKFRTMTDERDDQGNLLPDKDRLTPFGAWLRKTSLDELPETFNILNGTMSVIGPRPQLVRDMVFMTDEQRMRHTAKPGLSGLAQINGRNAIKWEDRFSWDVAYIQRVSFLEDVRIVFKTVKKAFIRQEGITEENSATSTDFGDYLLESGKIDKSFYDTKQKMARQILMEVEGHANKSAVREA